jgi:hypothetical protein
VFRAVTVRKSSFPRESPAFHQSSGGADPHTRQTSTRHAPPPLDPPFWPAWAARQLRKTQNFERVLRALPLIYTP